MPEIDDSDRLPLTEKQLLGQIRTELRYIRRDLDAVKKIYDRDNERIDDLEKFQTALEAVKEATSEYNIKIKEDAEHRMKQFTIFFTIGWIVIQAVSFILIKMWAVASAVASMPPSAH